MSPLKLSKSRRMTRRTPNGQDQESATTPSRLLGFHYDFRKLVCDFEIARKVFGCRYLQWTVMGWLPDCCCCFCTAAMMLIMPLPSVGMPTSGQPWKWNWRTARALFSWKDSERKDLDLCLKVFLQTRHHFVLCGRTTRVLSHSVVGDQEVPHCVALVLLLPFDLDGDVPVDHRSITGPILSALLLEDMEEMFLNSSQQSDILDIPFQTLHTSGEKCNLREKKWSTWLIYHTREAKRRQIPHVCFKVLAIKGNCWIS